MLCLYFLVKYRLPTKDASHNQSLSLKAKKLAILAGFIIDGSKQMLIKQLLIHLHLLLVYEEVYVGELVLIIVYYLFGTATHSLQVDASLVCHH